MVRNTISIVLRETLLKINFVIIFSFTAIYDINSMLRTVKLSVIYKSFRQLRGFGEFLMINGIINVICDCLIY